MPTRVSRPPATTRDLVVAFLLGSAVLIVTNIALTVVLRPTGQDVTTHIVNLGSLALGVAVGWWSARR